LILAGMILGASLVWWWSDEVWGPRYLHCAVAPLIVCMAAANTLLHGKRLRTTAFVTLAFCGLGVSMLGALFEYHSLHWVAILSSPSNIEQLQYDVEWNPIWFDARLMRLWLRGRDAPVSHIDYWPPPDHYVVSLPENLIEYIHPVNIREYAVPQTYLIKTWRNWQDCGDLVWWWVCATSLVLGSGGFAMAASRAGQPGRGEPATETPLSL